MVRRPRNGSKTIVIVGAGFSGAVTAAHILRRGVPAGAQILVADPSRRVARGLAFGTSNKLHVLNVPATRMSAFEDDENGFLRFARRLNPTVAGGAYVERRWYGDYLHETLMQAARQPAPGMELVIIPDVVTSLEPADSVMGVAVTFSKEHRVLADRVILAFGSCATTGPPAVDAGFFASARYVRDPWAEGSLDSLQLELPILLIGTGLTMVDIALCLQARGRPGPVFAVSRHGLLPRPHDPDGAGASVDEPPPGFDSVPGSARTYLRSVRNYLAVQAARGIDWRRGIDSLRAMTPALWRRMPLAEKARFLRHVRPYWDVHRHRAPPGIRAELDRAIASAWLQIVPGRIVAFSEHAGGVAVAIRRRGDSSLGTIDVGSVINCMGPAADTRSCQDTLFANLRSRGILAPDALGLGIEVADDGAVIGAAGAASRFIYYVGPMLRARDWEATAVPELRRHAERLAQSICESLRE